MGAMISRILVATGLLTLVCCTNKRESSPKEAPRAGAPAKSESIEPPVIEQGDSPSPPASAATKGAAISVDASVAAEKYVPSKPAGKVEEQLRVLTADMPVGMKTDACDELCMIEAICSEKVTGEDYNRGNRCVDNCENWGDEGMRNSEECVRVALTCATALECFD